MINEDVNPMEFTSKGLIDISKDEVRDNINIVLTNSLKSCCLTPYIALEKVRKALSYFHVYIPGTVFMEGERGFRVFDVDQFGLLYGMKDDGSVVTINKTEKDLTHGAHKEGEDFNKVHPPETTVNKEKFHVYFEYKLNDHGMFDVFCEIVTQSELDDLLSDVEDDMNDESPEDDREEKLDEEKKSMEDSLKGLL